MLEYVAWIIPSDLRSATPHFIVRWAHERAADHGCAARVLNHGNGVYEVRLIKER